MHHEAIVGEFTQQAESFNSSALANAPEMLRAVVAVADPHDGERWLDAACGPGAVTRALAGGAGHVLGVDATPAMIAVARREALDRGIGNTSFALGDATALDLPAGSFDGALSRFAIHHIPVPRRLVDELARVVRPGGKVVLADHVADPDAEVRAWAQEIERLRDPSHWACLTVPRLRALGEGAGLQLEAEAMLGLALDFDDWLRRGSGGESAAPLVERLLAERPNGGECFRVRRGGGHRVLELRLWISRWRR